MLHPLLAAVSVPVCRRSECRVSRFDFGWLRKVFQWVLLCVFGAVSGGFCVASRAASTAAEADAKFAQVSAWPKVAEWVFDRSSELAGAVSVVPVQGAYPLVLLPGVSVVEDARAPGGKALRLDGSQINWAATTNLLATKENVYIDLRFCASADGAERQTLMKLSKGPEIRINLKTSTVELILWTVEKKFVSVRVPYVADEWSALRASVIDGVLTLELNGEIATARMPEGAVIEAGPSRLFLGFYGDRPFKGSVVYLALHSP